MGWMPSYPTFNRNPLDLADEAAAAGEPVAEHVVERAAGPASCASPARTRTRRRTSRGCCRSGGPTCSARRRKGNEYFLKHLLGTDSSLRATEAPPDQRPRDVVWHDEAPEGKLDLLLTLDFRQTSTTMFSDVVLPAATWYEKHDLNTTDMHPFVHSFNPAIAPPWQTRTDWDAWQTIAAKFSRARRRRTSASAGTSSPCRCTHDTPDAMANPHGVVRDWKAGECEPGARASRCRSSSSSSATTARSRAKMGALGPLMEKLGATTKGVTFDLSREVDYLRRKNGAVRGGVGRRPAVAGRATCTRARRSSRCRARRTGTWPRRGSSTLEERTGVRLADLAAEHEGKQITFADTQAGPDAGDHVAGVVGLGARRAALLAVHDQRRAAQAVAHADRPAALLPRPRLDDGARRGAAGVPAAAGHDARCSASPSIGGARASCGVTVRYLTPHNKWSIHSEYQDNLFMLSLSRGGQTIWMSDRDAAKVGIEDNDWIEAVNRNGVVVARAIVSHRMPEGTVYMHHAQDRLIDVPLAETSGKRGGIHNSLTRLLVKPSHLIGGYAQLSLRLQLPRAHRQPARRGHRRSAGASQEVPVLMRVMAQMAMVMNLDKCIGCHTCSVTCKQAWTNRTGIEYVWFNNVETRPGQGYPRTYEDQEKWKGGWALNRRGRLTLKAGGRLQEAADDLLQPEAAVDPGLLRALDLRLRDADQRARAGAHPGRPAQVADQRQGHEGRVVGELGRRPRRRAGARPQTDPVLQEDLRQGEARVRADVHVLPAADLRALPQPVVRGVVPVAARSTSAPRTASCSSTRTGAAAGGCASPAARTRRSTSTTAPARPRSARSASRASRSGIPTVCSETCVGRLRYIGLVLYDADRVLEAASTPDEHRPLRGAARRCSSTRTTRR